LRDVTSGSRWSAFEPLHQVRASQLPQEEQAEINVRKALALGPRDSLQGVLSLLSQGRFHSGGIVPFQRSVVISYICYHNRND
jgi:hypothetical protein